MGDFQIGVQPRSLAPLDTVVGPQDLLAVVKPYHVEWFPGRMRRRERAVPRGCQSWVNTTLMNRLAKVLMTGTTRRPLERRGCPPA